MSEARYIDPKWGPLPESLKERPRRREPAERGKTVHDRAFSAERKRESYLSHQSSSRGFRR